MARQELEPVYSWLGATMTELRKAKGLTQTEVAERMGVHVTTVTYYEQGGNRVRLHALLAWCRAVGADPADVVTRVVQETDEAEQEACRDKPKT